MYERTKSRNRKINQPNDQFLFNFKLMKNYFKGNFIPNGMEFIQNKLTNINSIESDLMCENVILSVCAFVWMNVRAQQST